MYRCLLIFLFMTAGYFGEAQQRLASPTAKLQKTEIIKPETLQFAEQEFDFGKIPQGKPVTHVFYFRNTGKEPVVLTDVHASCGCTTPEWSRDTIPAGGTASIKVGFNAAATGEFVKPVFITYNGNQTMQLIIKGDVWGTPDQSAPENNLVNQLNKYHSTIK